MNAPFILALTGRPDVGKDTIADILAGHGFTRIAFVEALRAEVAAAWRVDPRMLTDRPTKEKPLPALAVGMCSEPGFKHWIAAGGETLTEPRSPRWVLQRWGTYQRRYVPGYYAAIVERAIRRQIGAGRARIVVTDLRYPVEGATMRRLGAFIVRVHRPDATPLAADTATDESERYAAIIEADADIVNDGSLQALAETVHEIVQRLEAWGVVA
ncbi:hypothetical protein C8245_13845 [Paracidovorax avenae]|uniref:deoxynucleotide monophosphate kinase family protein n=1 Tax=Paracidovorax avenae TaxID=80867 RepID=UPI000D1FFDB8|nr:hypothetical protein [Paracidovorax avenae]AVS66617.1 hypothetical protein C8245_13845 [Paracidovorax avenae]